MNLKRQRQRFPPYGHFIEPGHDHAECISSVHARAEEICRRRGARLTPIRRTVLDLVWRSHQPIGAYEILAMLNAKGGSTAPPTVYRALEFLQRQGFVHKVETLNAFVGCSDPGHSHVGCFLICLECQSTAEIDGKSVTAAIENEAAAAEFSVQRCNIEIHGLCPSCKNKVLDE